MLPALYYEYIILPFIYQSEEFVQKATTFYHILSSFVIIKLFQKLYIICINFLKILL